LQSDTVVLRCKRQKTFNDISLAHLVPELNNSSRGVDSLLVQNTQTNDSGAYGKKYWLFPSHVNLI